MSRSGSNLLHFHAVTDVGWCDQLRPIQRKRRTRADHKRNNQLYMKRLQQVLGLWGRREWPHSVRHGCAVVSQIQDPALMLGVDGARMCLDKATAPIRHPIPLETCWEGIGAAGEGKRAATM